MARSRKKSGGLKDVIKLAAALATVFGAVFRAVMWLCRAIVQQIDGAGKGDNWKAGWKANLSTVRSGLNIPIQITYFDADGQPSERVIVLQEILGPKKARTKGYISHIYGYCELRKEMRHFKIDHVTSVINKQTGVVADTPGRSIRFFKDMCEG